jgi:hypothetical protein
MTNLAKYWVASFLLLGLASPAQAQSLGTITQTAQAATSDGAANQGREKIG